MIFLSQFQEKRVQALEEYAQTLEQGIEDRDTEIAKLRNVDIDSLPKWDL